MGVVGRKGEHIKQAYGASQFVKHDRFLVPFTEVANPSLAHFP